MAALPGVTRATLQAATGKLTVEGQVDLAAIRREGQRENYTIHPEDAAPPAVRRGVDGNLVRAALASAALLAAYGAQGAGAPAAVAVPLFSLATVAGGWGNFRKAIRAIPRRDFNMSVLMTIAVIGAAAIGQWEEGAVVACLFAVSEWLESWTFARARRSLRALMDLAPRVALVRRPGGEVLVPVAEIRVGDRMIVRPGEKIAMDGRIVAGASAINEAPITGESVPVEKGPGAPVYAGTLSIDGALEVEVTSRAEDTAIARIIHLVEAAQAQRAPAQAFVEQFAARYTPLVLALAAGIALVPPLFPGQAWAPWIYRGLALLVVSCPCALVVSTPVAIVSAIGNAARHGVLIKGGVHLEALGAIAAVAFDKTGTLTRGEPAVAAVIPLAGQAEADLLALAAAVEAHSQHPLAQAIVRAAAARRLAVEPAAAGAALPGRGAQGEVGGQLVRVGNRRWFAELGLATPPVAAAVARLEAEGKTAMLVGTAAGCLGIIAVADALRPEGPAVVAALRRAGIRKTILLTGDNPATARAVAARAGVDEFRAELLPEDKAAAVQELLQAYGRVAMVGDGINDAPALATATVGIAMGGVGTDVALETADVVLMADDLHKLPFAIRLSRAALRVIRQNIALALATKALAVLAVFPGWLTLWLAILADMGVSVLVTLNGMRLLRIKPDP